MCSAARCVRACGRSKRTEKAAVASGRTLQKSRFTSVDILDFDGTQQITKCDFRRVPCKTGQICINKSLLLFFIPIHTINIFFSQVSKEEKIDAFIAVNHS